MLDYQEIVNNLTIDKVKSILTNLKIDFEDRGSYLVMPTYCHNNMGEDASHKLYFYKNNKIFMCFTECGTMSIFKFLKNFYNAQNREYDWYNDIYRVIVGETEAEGISFQKYRSLRENYDNPTKEINLPEYNNGALDCFVDWYAPEWKKDGISEEAMKKFEIKFSISQNKIIIPHRDVCGRLVGIRGRALNEEEIEQYGKYAPIWIEGKCYSHPLSMNLYGLYQNKENIKKTRICYLCESEKAVLQAESFNISNCVVAVCGSQFNKYQLHLLLKYCAPQEIVICFDNEEKNNEENYFNKLYDICSKYKNYADFYFIYDRFNLTKKKDSPTDNGEEIFKKLLERKIKVK